MKDNSSRWMFISGTVAIIFFLISNFSKIDVRLNLLTGAVQIAINVFVFITWTKGFTKSFGMKKFIAFFGVIIPPIMALITFFRVIM